MLQGAIFICAGGPRRWTIISCVSRLTQTRWLTSSTVTWDALTSRHASSFAAPPAAAVRAADGDFVFVELHGSCGPCANRSKWRLPQRMLGVKQSVPLCGPLWSSPSRLQLHTLPQCRCVLPPSGCRRRNISHLSRNLRSPRSQRSQLATPSRTCDQCGCAVRHHHDSESRRFLPQAVGVCPPPSLPRLTRQRSAV